MRIFVLFMACVLALAVRVSANSAPVVANVTAVQRTDGSRLVDICYDLTDADGDRCTVSVAVSSDNGATWTVQVASMTGALGPGIPLGNGRQIVWDAGKDLPGAYGTDYRVRITADDGKEPDDNKPPLPADMVLIPGGEFLMGDHFNEGEYGETPVHKVQLDSFCIGKYEITNRQYCDFLNSARSQRRISVNGAGVYLMERWHVAGSALCCMVNWEVYGGSILWNGSAIFSVTPGKEDHPANTVTWYGAIAYCNWRSEQAGYESCYSLLDGSCDFSKRGFRLPTEAEWEYAARGGLAGKRFPYGDTMSHSQANYSGWGVYHEGPTSGCHPVYKCHTAPVGSLAPNNYGLYDMAGNVEEWCHDWYSSVYYSKSPDSNPTGPTKDFYRVLRGGRCSSALSSCRVASRSYFSADSFWADTGFRMALDVE